MPSKLMERTAKLRDLILIAPESEKVWVTKPHIAIFLAATAPSAMPF